MRKSLLLLSTIFYCSALLIAWHALSLQRMAQSEWAASQHMERPVDITVTPDTRVVATLNRTSGMDRTARLGLDEARVALSAADEDPVAVSQSVHQIDLTGLGDSPKVGRQTGVQIDRLVDERSSADGKRPVVEKALSRSTLPAREPKTRQGMTVGTDQHSTEQTELLDAEKGQADEWVLRIPFRSGQRDLDDKGRAALLAVLPRLAGKLTSRKLLVEGHADTSQVYSGLESNAEGNWSLSLKRAKAVAAFLAENGIAATAMVVQGRGDASPLASNATADGRAANRRVDVRLQDESRFDWADP